MMNTCNDVIETNTKSIITKSKYNICVDIKRKKDCRDEK